MHPHTTEVNLNHTIDEEQTWNLTLQMTLCMDTRGEIKRGVNWGHLAPEKDIKSQFQHQQKQTKKDCLGNELPNCIVF